MKLRGILSAAPHFGPRNLGIVEKRHGKNIKSLNELPFSRSTIERYYLNSRDFKVASTLDPIGS